MTFFSVLGLVFLLCFLCFAALMRLLFTAKKKKWKGGGQLGLFASDLVGHWRLILLWHFWKIFVNSMNGKIISFQLFVVWLLVPFFCVIFLKPFRFFFFFLPSVGLFHDWQTAGQAPCAVEELVEIRVFFFSYFSLILLSFMVFQRFVLW